MLRCELEWGMSATINFTGAILFNTPVVIRYVGITLHLTQAYKWDGEIDSRQGTDKEWVICL